MTSVLRTVPVPVQRTGTTPAPTASPDVLLDTLPEALLARSDADADKLADDIHDGALQSLVVARYAADAVLRGGDPAIVRDAVQEALVALRLLVWELRPRSELGLDAALQALAAHRLAAGCPPLRLDVDVTAAESLVPAAASVAYRFVQHAAGDRPVAVRVVASPGAVLVEIDAPVHDPDAEALGARSIGGSLTVHATGATLRLPLPCPALEPAHEEVP